MSGQNELWWTYDIVYRGERIIALCFHPGPSRNAGQHVSCLNVKADRLMLEREGLKLGLGSVFSTLEQAKAAAWKQREQFDGGLD